MIWILMNAALAFAAVAWARGQKHLALVCLGLAVMSFGSSDGVAPPLKVFVGFFGLAITVWPLWRLLRPPRWT